MTTSPQEQDVENDQSPLKSLIKLDVFPGSFRNEQFEENLTYFKTAQPTIYNAVVNHRCTEYKLCTNPDGSPNIIETKSNAPVYNTFDKATFWDFINKSIDNLAVTTIVQQAFLGDDDELWKKNNPIQFGMLNSLYEGGVFQQLGVKTGHLEPLINYRTDFFPFIRIYGIGLGYHLTELIRKKTISYMSIYEPKLDLFYTSLYTIPWKLIFQYFDTRGKGINLILGGDPDHAIRQNAAFLQQRLMPLSSCFYRLVHLGSAETNELIKKEPQADSTEREQSDAGWYEDQRTGFYLSARNIIEKNKFFNGKKTKSFFRAFVVGAGPSLNDAIDYLKDHQHDGIIVSCGSAITPLLSAGIVPDYEVVQERVWQFTKNEQKHDLDLMKRVTLLKLNVVSTKIDQYYNDTLVFQKFRDPGSALLDSKKYPATTAVNPTVTNAGISMCADLGVNEVYLFGVDYGVPKGSEKMHAKNTIYDNEKFDDSVSDKITPYELPGNLGTVIKTTPVLSWSHDTTEFKIAQFPMIKWFNVGEGALIKGAKPLAPEALPRNFKKKINKRMLFKEIRTCFDNTYSTEAVINLLKTVQMQQIDNYFDVFLGFCNSTPQTREEIIAVLSLMYKAVNTGKDQQGYLPSSLLPYGFIQFITNVYMQCALAKNDAQAVEFFHDAMNVLNEYVKNIKEDINHVVNDIDSKEESDTILLSPYGN